MVLVVGLLLACHHVNSRTVASANCIPSFIMGQGSIGQILSNSHLWYAYRSPNLALSLMIF